MSRKNQNRVPSTHAHRTLIIFSLSVFLATVIIISASYAWRWMTEPTSFPITKVNIEGQLTHENPAAISHIMQTQLRGGFFSLNVSAISSAILAFPWVADVSFRRVWPHTLNVRITEQKAIARFGKTGVLNEKGDVFYPDAQSMPNHLPDLIGPIDQSKVLFNFYRTVNPLAQLLGLTVTTLQVNNEQRWNLQLSNQVRVELGRQQILARFKRFVAIYPKIIAVSNRPMISIDLRYPNGVAVQYADATISPSKKA